MTRGHAGGIPAPLTRSVEGSRDGFFLVDRVEAVARDLVEPLVRGRARDAHARHVLALDLRDGFIHFSTAAQVRETAARHFAGAADLLLVAVSTEALGPALTWEPSRGGDLFPHLYGELPFEAVRWVTPLPLDAAGQHVFPPLE